MYGICLFRRAASTQRVRNGESCFFAALTNTHVLSPVLIYARTDDGRAGDAAHRDTRIAHIVLYFALISWRHSTELF